MRLRSLVAAALVASTLAAYAAVIDVLSGDLIQIDTKVWRVANIDAPPLDSPCPDVHRLGELAQAKLAEIIGQGELEIRPTGQHDANNRAMAFVLINGEDVGEKMIAAKLAQRHGEAVELCRLPKPAEQH